MYFDYYKLIFRRCEYNNHPLLDYLALNIDRFILLSSIDDPLGTADNFEAFIKDACDDSPELMKFRKDLEREINLRDMFKRCVILC